MRRDAFQAIADPNRRQILAALAIGALTLNGIAEQFDITRPAVSKHVKILEECGLVEIIPRGRERLCLARFEGLKEVSEWVQSYRQFWETKLNDLENYLNQIQSQNTSKTP